MGSASARLHFIILFLANNADGQQIRQSPSLLHLLLTLPPVRVFDVDAVELAAPELKWKEEERRGGMLSDDASREGRKIEVKIIRIITYDILPPPPSPRPPRSKR